MKIKSILLAFSFLVSTSLAKASVLDFEGVTTEGSLFLNAAEASYGGFIWDDGFSLYDASVFPTAVHSGSYGIVNAYGLDLLSVSSSSAFNFNGAWLNGWYFNAPSAVTISGYDASNNLIGSFEQVIAEGEEVYASANFIGVSRIEFTGGQYFTIDDFSFDVQEVVGVSEPNILSMFVLGVLSLYFVRRKTV